MNDINGVWEFDVYKEQKRKDDDYVIKITNNSNEKERFLIKRVGDKLFRKLTKDERKVIKEINSNQDQDLTEYNYFVGDLDYGNKVSNIKINKKVKNE
jgi:hypothetical protein